MAENNGGTEKMVGFILVLLSIIAGVTAIIRPMQQSIDTLQSQFKFHEEHESHPESGKEIARLKEKFVEVDTQFHSLDERTKRIEEQSNIAVTKLDEKLQRETKLASQNLDTNIARLDEKLQIEIGHVSRELERIRIKEGEPSIIEANKKFHERITGSN